MTNNIPEIIDEAKRAGCENADQVIGYLAAEVSRLRTPTPVVTYYENRPGISGPDSAIVSLRNGKALEIGDDGLTVFSSLKVLNAGLEPEASITWGERPAPHKRELPDAVGHLSASNEEFETRCRILINEEQEKVSPNAKLTDPAAKNL